MVIMKIKKYLTVLLCILLTISFTGCGMTQKEFVSAVRAHQISLSVEDIKTISDFEEKMESYNDENSEWCIDVTTSWNEEKLKEDDSFIKALVEETDFAYDSGKYYGKLDVNTDVFSVDGNVTKEEYTLWYLFSVDKDNNVKMEAAAKSLGHDMFDYSDFVLGDFEVQDRMSADILVLEMMTGFYGF